MADMKMKNFPKNPTVNGTPANEAMAMSMANERNGARFDKPAKSAISPPVFSATTMRMMKLSVVIKR